MRKLKSLLREEIKNRFTYHPPSKNQLPKYERIRKRIRTLALNLDQELPESREKALALTKLEECMFHVNSAIARRTI